MAGLFIREKLSEDLSKYAMPDKMKQMLATLQQNVGVKMLSDEDYATILHDEATNV